MINNEVLGSSALSDLCTSINYYILCDGSCTGECDGFSCPTGQCIHESIRYEFCGQNPDLPIDHHISDLPQSSGGGGSDYVGIYIPIPYQGDEDISNPDFMLAVSVSGFIKTITDANFSIKQLLRAHEWIYPNLIDFIRQNGGLYADNQNAIVFALSHLSSFIQHAAHAHGWDNTTANQYQFNTLMYLLHNPNTPQAQLNWLANNPNAAAYLFQLLRDDDSQESKDAVNNAITELANQTPQVLTAADYPGKNDGLSFEWWLDDNSEVVQNWNGGPGLIESWKNVTNAERVLIHAFPIQAYMIYKNRAVADFKMQQLFGAPTLSQMNAKPDAYHHAYFNAINTLKVGVFFASLFAIAHESENKPQWEKEKTMDLFNNAAGINFIKQNPSTNFQDVDSLIYQMLLNGDLEYLSPIDYDDPNFDDNPNTEDEFDGTHGITSATHFKPTNQ